MYHRHRFRTRASPHIGVILRNNGRYGDLVKLLWHDGVGMSLYAKRLEVGKFIWPMNGSGGAMQVSAAQLGYLLEGIDWRKKARPFPHNQDPTRPVRCAQHKGKTSALPPSSAELSNPIPYYLFVLAGAT